jgi:hypothetical protein
VNVKQDEKFRTHIDWELDAITPRMIDWFWSNMEKGYALWHPIEHKAFRWAIPPEDSRALGAIHVAPQRWSDGTLIEPHIRYDDVATLPQDVADLIVYDHCVAAAGIALFTKDYKPDNAVVAYRIHQWEATDSGVRGRSSAVPMKAEPLETERGMIWAKHANEEVHYWGDFLPELYRLFSVVQTPEMNPFSSLKVKREGKVVRYVDQKYVAALATV